MAEPNLEDTKIYEEKPEQATPQPPKFQKPSRSINLIVIGMAGSGKTTFMGVLSIFIPKNQTQ
jgi:GTPase SAR1 family protein